MPVLRWSALTLLTLGYCIAWVYGQLSLPVVVTFGLLIMAGICVVHFRHWAVRGFGHALFIALAAGLACHWLPGFFSARVIAAARFTPEAAPFSMYLNLDKPLIGFWIILACPWVFAGFNLRRSLITIGLTLPLTLLVCLTTALGMGVVGWTPKWPEQGGIWVLNNLLLVTMTEELIFRGYLQGGLSRLLARMPNAPTLALLISSLLFGVMHLGGGWQWMILTSIAGLGYGIAYRYGGLPAAVITHFGLNLAHFSLFTYPMFDR
ncbi:CPBP family intramembrane glutamic endopeptidase [Pseudomonas sp. SLFW]|uniref:CPBP family intramembrane glutamic endopeptidase n=1 Tax=Pseudomonas sp. SLFW TaxID=2683259 RepID=UPI0014128666|nr:CPBP family intramembrane glutamic endopeptidase [Pseudomonas sp. SLFW]NBB13386.1 CPBP family intramembrane metalloprotease [Pseudomonas sp. SLFW]